jgi:NAD(P)H-nitrite reductase large subunit
MKKQKLVVVGNGMAGIRTLEELLKLAPERYEITVFGAEPYPNYNRILLSPVLAGEMTIQDITLNPLEWYRDTTSACIWASTSSRSIAAGARSLPPTASKSTTTACCWPPVRRPSCRRFRGSICPA